MRRRMMASIGGGAKKMPTARDYIQSGLIAMWDGIENAGWGTHDAAATVWKDLVGDADLSPVGTLAWGDKSPVFGGNLYFAANDKLMLGEGDITAECVAQSTGSLTNQGFIGFTNGSGRFLWMFAGYPLESIEASLIWQYKGSAATRAHYNEGSLNELFSSSLVSADGLINCFKNGVKREITNDIHVGTVKFGRDNRIGSIGLNFPSLTGIIPCVRIYNRALTAAEVAANYAIDKARFGLA